MRIGFVGNTNNYPFMLAMAVRRLGHDVTFVVDSEEKLHRPEFMYEPAAWGGIEVHFVPAIRNYRHAIASDRVVRQVARLAESCDALIVNGLWPTLAARTGKPYIVLLTGSDLELHGDPGFVIRSYWRQLSSRNMFERVVRALFAAEVARRQRAAIVKATAYNYFPRGVIPNGDRILDSLAARAGKRLSFMMTDVERCAYVPPPPDGPVLRLLLAARLNWVHPKRPGLVELDYKGTDIFLHGLKLFKEQDGRPLSVVMVKKGHDVQPTVDLVEQLGLREMVEWHDEMSQRELLEQYKVTDIVVDQFAKGVVGMAGLDAMAMGRPVLANGRPEIFEPTIGEPSPICQAANPEEVFRQLVRLFDPGVRDSVGKQSRKYVERHFSTHAAAQRCLAVFGCS